MSADHLDERAIVAALRGGVVPHRGLDRFVVGLDPIAAAVAQELDFVAAGKGAAKWLRGDYGSGKTFAARYLCARARERAFASAEVQVSINDTPLHRLETVYRRLVERLETTADGSNAFRSVIERWLFRVGEEVKTKQGLDEDDPRLVALTEGLLEHRLSDVSRRTPAFAAMVRAYHRASASGDGPKAQALLSWLSGQPHTNREALKAAGVSGKLDGQGAIGFLAGLLQLLRESGSSGLVLVLDEVETIQRMPANQREKSLNALRQFVDALANEELPGLYLLITGTSAFFETPRGVKALPPLYQRMQVDFAEDPAFDNLLAPQVRLPLFDAQKLITVGRKVRELYPAQHPERLEARITQTFLRALVKGFTERFGGNLSVAPRTFLRELVDVMDKVEQHEGFNPLADYKLVLADSELNDEELAATSG